jgi:hypothetical protein
MQLEYTRFPKPALAADFNIQTLENVNQIVNLIPIRT